MFSLVDGCMMVALSGFPSNFRHIRHGQMPRTKKDEGATPTAMILVPFSSRNSMARWPLYLLVRLHYSLVNF